MISGPTFGYRRSPSFIVSVERWQQIPCQGLLGLPRPTFIIHGSVGSSGRYSEIVPELLGAGSWWGPRPRSRLFILTTDHSPVAILAQSCSGSVSAVPALSELFQLCVATMSGSSAAAASEAFELHGSCGLHGEYLFIPYDALEAPSGRMSKREPSEKTVLKAVNDRRSRGSQQSFTWPQKGSQVTQPPTVCLSEVANSVRGGGGVGSQPRTSLTAGGWAPPLVPPSERFIRLFARPKDPPDSGHDVSLSVVGMQGPGAGARLQFG